MLSIRGAYIRCMNGLHVSGIAESRGLHTNADVCAGVDTMSKMLQARLALRLWFWILRGTGRKSGAWHSMAGLPAPTCPKACCVECSFVLDCGSVDGIVTVEGSVDGNLPCGPSPGPEMEKGSVDGCALCGEEPFELDFGSVDGMEMERGSVDGSLLCDVFPRGLESGSVDGFEMEMGSVDGGRCRLESGSVDGFEMEKGSVDGSGVHGEVWSVLRCVVSPG